MAEERGVVRRFLPLGNKMLEAILEDHILKKLMTFNPLVEFELYYSLKIVIHSIEVIDEDFWVVHLEHYFVDVENRALVKPAFCQAEIDLAFVNLHVFNNEEYDDNDDGEPYEDFFEEYDS